MEKLFPKAGYLFAALKKTLDSGMPRCSVGGSPYAKSALGDKARCAYTIALSGSEGI